MCGIIGYAGPGEAVDILVSGLERLEYRGYDSSGIAVVGADGSLEVRRSQGKLVKLKERIREQPCSGRVGLGHTRWATHGAPSDVNAHPHQAGDTVVVHNGIIENYVQLKQEMGLSGAEYRSETDTEVIAHLVDRCVKDEGDFVAGVRKALKRLKGSYAVVILNRAFPEQLVAARKESPLVVGRGEGEVFFGSDVPAFLNHTRRVIFMEDGEIASVLGADVSFSDMDGRPLEMVEQVLDWSPVMAEKTGYSHFMEKEIFEQPRVIVDTFRGRMNPETGSVYLDETGFGDDQWGSIRRVVIVACGTSFHASIVGKFWIEKLAKIPVEVDLGSEFRYRDPLVSEGDLLVAVSQSGETADTLAAVREGKRKGALCLAVCNVVGSSLTRECDGVIYTHAGPEIGVASTKAFTTQLVVLYLLALHLGEKCGRLSGPESVEGLERLLELPGMVEQVLARSEEIRHVALKHFKAKDFLYLGRGMLYPIALEGALKLKEISYIHAEGYAAGEMKHGPIALIDDKLPVVVLVSGSAGYEKILGNLQEVKTRRGIVIAVTESDGEEVSRLADDTIRLPGNLGDLDPILWVVPLQLLAYHVAVLLGTDVDQPRNLAKSVTVE